MFLQVLICIWFYFWTRLQVRLWFPSAGRMAGQHPLPSRCTGEQTGRPKTQTPQGGIFRSTRGTREAQAPSSAQGRERDFAGRLALGTPQAGQLAPFKSSSSAEL